MYDLFPPLRALRERATGGRCRAASSRWWRSAAALLAAPRLLLLDEPSLGLAPIVVDDVFDVLGEVARRTPMLLVEQNTDRVLALAQRAYVLVKGRVVMEGRGDELEDRESLMASYLGQTTIEEPPADRPGS